MTLKSTQPEWHKLSECLDRFPVKMTEEQLKIFFASYTLLASPQFLQEYSLNTPQNFHLFNGETKSYNRFLLAKCDGGRCHCYIPCISLFSKHFTPEVRAQTD